MGLTDQPDGGGLDALPPAVTRAGSFPQVARPSLTRPPHPTAFTADPQPTEESPVPKAGDARATRPQEQQETTRRSTGMNATLPPELMKSMGRPKGRTSHSGRTVARSRLSSPQVEEFHERFNLPDEELLQWYSCALSLRILLHGRLYVTPNYVCFFSLFNDATIFGVEPTVVTIPFSTIASITKRNSALVFPNAIEIVCSDGTAHFFASFLVRDKVYDFLVSLWEDALAAVPSATPRLTSPTESPVHHTRRVALPFSARPTSPMPFPPPPFRHGSNFPSKPFDVVQPLVIWRRPLNAIVVQIFDNGPFWAKYLEGTGCQKIQVGKWDKPIFPADDDGNTPRPHREMRYGRAVKQAGLAVLLKLPDYAPVYDRWDFYAYSPSCVVVESRISVSDIPFAESLDVLSRYRLTQIAATETQLDVEFALDWKQSPLLKSRIERETLDDLRQTVARFADFATRFLNPSGAPVTVDVPAGGDTPATTTSGAPDTPKTPFGRRVSQRATLARTIGRYLLSLGQMLWQRSDFGWLVMFAFCIIWIGTLHIRIGVLEQQFRRLQEL